MSGETQALLHALHSIRARAPLPDELFCAWCGGEQPAQHTMHNGWCKARTGEWFCCRSHRDQSNAALLAFLNNPYGLAS